MVKAPQPPGAPSSHISHTHCDGHRHHNLSRARPPPGNAQLSRFCASRCAAATRTEIGAPRCNSRETSARGCPLLRRNALGAIRALALGGKAK
jgi:hypothetical protein